MRSSRRLMLAAGLLALGLAIAVTVAAHSAKQPSQTAPGESQTASNAGFEGFQLPPGTVAPRAQLTDQYGREVSLGPTAGQVTILAFLNSACGASCFLTAEQIRGTLDELGATGAGASVRVLIISTDPAADTRAGVARFLRSTSLSGRVEYLTGGLSQLRSITRVFGAAAPARPAGPNASGPARSRKPSAPSSYTYVVLVDPQGQAKVGFTLEQLTPEALAHDVRRLEGG